MANVNAPFGARRIGHLYGAPNNGQIHSYTVAAADATALFVGDFVKLASPGTAALGDDGFYHPSIVQAAAGDTVIGVVDSFYINPTYLNQIYRTASTLRTVFVCDDPDAIFEIQSNGTGVAGDIGSLADIDAGTAGSTVTGFSGMQLDEATVTTATAQLRILDISKCKPNAFGAYVRYICLINEHQLKTTTGV